MKYMKLEDVMKKYKDEWILAEVLKTDSQTKEPVKLKLLKHSKDRDEVDEAMRKTKAKHLTAFYTGKIG